MTTGDVFISYSSKDKNAADAACAALERRKIRCWIAPRDIVPGTPWGASIIEAMESVKAMVLVVSGNANSSPQIEREVERAVHRGVPVIPFRIEDIQPTKSLEYFISASHWLDAFAPPIERHLDRLVEVVQGLLLIKAAQAEDIASGGSGGPADVSLPPKAGGAASPWDLANSRATRRRPRAALIVVAVLILIAGAGLIAWTVLRPPATHEAPRVADTPPAAIVKATAIHAVEPSRIPLVPEEIPFLHEADRTNIRTRYLPATGHKVLAISYSAIGFAAAQQDDATARTIAMNACRTNTVAANATFPCVVYAVGNNVVSKLGAPPLPPEPWVIDDPAIAQPFALERLPLVSPAGANLRNYASASGSKALALTPLAAPIGGWEIRAQAKRFVEPSKSAVR